MENKGELEYKRLVGAAADAVAANVVELAAHVAAARIRAAPAVAALLN
jgi:hypothetical protein